MRGRNNGDDLVAARFYELPDGWDIDIVWCPYSWDPFKCEQCEMWSPAHIDMSRQWARGDRERIAEMIPNLPQGSRILTQGVEVETPTG